MSAREERRAKRIKNGERLLKIHCFNSPFWRERELVAFRKFIAQDRMRGGWNGVSRDDVSDMLLAIKDRGVGKP